MYVSQCNIYILNQKFSSKVKMLPIVKDYLIEMPTPNTNSCEDKEHVYYTHKIF